MLLFTSYLDLRKREVQDKVWLVFGAIGVILQVYEIHMGDSSLFQLGLSVVLATAVGMGLYFFGFYGGADGKALIVKTDEIGSTSFWRGNESSGNNRLH
ncbi:MAG: prepilin peptidase, partial [Nitrososphaerota archaeon]|nr:prepilin peptidase [Nitrososphaerota archaeon]